MIQKVNFEEAKHILDSDVNCVLMDVREEAEYITGHASGSVLLPVGQISAASAAEMIPTKDTVVLVYCKSGIRSAKAAKALSALGYERIYDIGSLSGWPYGLE